jgi:hypothetical protein
MAKKRRKRKQRRPRPDPAPAAETAAVPPGERQPSASSRRTVSDGPPAPLWGSFPLTELVILIGIVLLVTGFLMEPPRGTFILVIGLTLAALGGLELAAREHFAGYRSHNAALAGTVGVATAAVLTFATDVDPRIAVASGAVVFLPAAWGFATAFRRRSGGALYRFKPDSPRSRSR